MNKNTKPVPNLHTYEIRMIKLAVKKMQGAKLYAILLASVMLVSLSPAFSTSLPHVVIRSTGRIGANDVTANSGRRVDIRAAVDEAASTGKTIVRIPEGTFDFNTEAEGWVSVNIDLADFPNGLSILGAETERTSGLTVPTYGMNPNDQVLNDNWKTVLFMSWAPDGGTAGNENRQEFFNIDGISTRATVAPFFRISDIKFVGHKTFDPTDEDPTYVAVDLNNVIDFRIDHCMLEHITAGISIDTNVNGESCGVIDHCKLVNPLCDEPGVMTYYNRDVGYGADISHHPSNTRFEPIDQVLGQYTLYTTFIENCYFSRWRHCIASGYGAYYVARHNTIEGDFASSSFDTHGTYTNVPARGAEIYNNEFLDIPDEIAEYRDAVGFRGGGGCIFNNYADGTYGIGAYPAYRAWCNERLEDINDLFFWDNFNEPDKYNDDCCLLGYGVTDSTHAHLRKPDLTLDGFSYTSYPYPHPLTLG